MNKKRTPKKKDTPPPPPITGSTFEDWIETGDVMKLLNITENTLRRYIDEGILHYTLLIKRKLFYKPHILRSLESRYR